MHFTYKYERGNIGVLSMSFYVIFVAVDYRRYYCTRFSSRKATYCTCSAIQLAIASSIRPHAYASRACSSARHACQ